MLGPGSGTERAACQHILKFCKCLCLSDVLRLIVVRNRTIELCHGSAAVPVDVLCVLDCSELFSRAFMASLMFRTFEYVTKPKDNALCFH